METNNSLFSDFNRKVKQLDKILIEFERARPERKMLLKRWRQTLTTTNEMRLNFSLPITCIGPVKSGKSTLINTLAGSDLLPTGAGITTNFPTKLSANKNFSAEIKLQPEAVINELFTLAVNLLFSDEFKQSVPSLFNPQERLRVKKLLNSYQRSGNLTRDGIFNESYRLLKNLTSGVDKVNHYYLDKNLKTTIDDPQNPKYRSFIRDESISPFLSEIHIKAPLKLLPQHLSLRDLPGLDTPNPSHQNIIIQQLNESPALIYVISSRIGLRQADYQLLEHLHQLELEKRLIFVINLDLDVHQNSEDMLSMIKRCSDELNESGFAQPKYAFSTLALFWSRAEIASTLPESSRQRLQAWEKDQKKFALSQSGAQLFLDRLLELGRNETEKTLLQYSELQLAQIHNNCRRLINSELEQLKNTNDSLISGTVNQNNNCQQIESMQPEIKRIISGICTEVESFGHNQISNWLANHNDSSLRHKLAYIIDSYQAPLEHINEKKHNPLTPITIIDNHFKLTIPAQIQETVTIETIKFIKDLHLQINERLLKGCIPLFVICKNFSDNNEIDQDDLPLPIKINQQIPPFTLRSGVEERFAIIDKIQGLAQLMGRKIFRFRKRLSLGEEYTLQIKKAAQNELPRWLRNYREQLKFALIRQYIELCQELITTFFTDFLISTQASIVRTEESNDNNRKSCNQQITELEKILELFKED